MRRARAMMLGLLGGGGDAPAGISDLVATANLAGTITVTWTLPAGATHARVRYNVDQEAAPGERYLGIDLGLVEGETVTLTGVEYGATYRFSAWAWNEEGYANQADTASATGPLNPSAYGTLSLWLDARRETPINDDTDAVAPTDWSASPATFSQATDTKRPHYRTAAGAGAINGMASWDFDRAAAQMWDGTAKAIHGAGGMTLAAIAKTEDAAISEFILTKWQTSGNLREWRLGKTTGDYVMYLSDDGVGNAYVQGSDDDTNAHSIIGIWKPGVATYFYSDGDAVEDTDATMNYADIGPASPAATLRFGSEVNATTNTWDGPISLVLGWSEAISPTAAELLNAALAALAGT